MCKLIKKYKKEDKKEEQEERRKKTYEELEKIFRLDTKKVDRLCRRLGIITLSERKEKREKRILKEEIEELFNKTFSVKIIK